MFGEEGYNPFQAEHAQCNECGVMLRGPHKDTVFEDTNVYAADRERVYTRDESEAAGLRHNVSGSLCPECFQAKKAKLAADRDKAAARGLFPGRYAQVRETRRLNHEKHEAQLEATRQRKAQLAVDQKASEEASKRAREKYRQSAPTGQEDIS